MGFGSIGRFHLSKIKGYEVYIVDPKLNSEYLIPDELKSNNIFTFANITQLPKTLYSGAVVANWGPDHLATVRKLRKLGIKNFILEKPLVDSLWDLHKLAKEKKKYNLEISIHIQWNYSGLVEKLIHLAEFHNLGKARSAIVFGGAKCLVMNGIHYLALTNKIFGEFPIDVKGLLSTSRINPRGERFLYYEGNLSYKYESEKYLALSFSNSSRVSAEYYIIFDRGTALISSNKLEVYGINQENLKSDPRVVKTFESKESKYFGEAFRLPDGSDGSDYIYKNFVSGNEVKDSFGEGLEATKWILEGLISSGKYKSNWKKMLKIHQYLKHWNIT